jgi:hypothetical protein
VADEVRRRLIAEGHDEAHFAIVGSGPNSASPHHEASDRVIAAGEPIVLDIGGTLGGYGSDITRTLWVTGGNPAKGPDERFRHLFGVLHGAQAAARAAVKPALRAKRRCCGLARSMRGSATPSSTEPVMDRPGGPPGAVTQRPQHRALASPDGHLGRAPDLHPG